MLSFARTGPEVSWPIDNASESAIRLTSLEPSYPDDNQLLAIWLGGQLLWERPADGPAPETGDLPGDARTVVEPGTVVPLRLVFTWPDDQLRYSLGLGFDTGCALSTSW
jgi:hypothetical protein